MEHIHQHTRTKLADTINGLRKRRANIMAQVERLRAEVADRLNLINSEILDHNDAAAELISILEDVAAEQETHLETTDFESADAEAAYSDWHEAWWKAARNAEVDLEIEEMDDPEFDPGSADAEDWLDRFDELPPAP